VPVLDATGIGLGDKVNIEAKAGTLVMTLVDEPMTLEDLLADSPKKSFRVLEEDQDWIDAKPTGREI
jgi:antitoxin ChpS